MILAYFRIGGIGASLEACFWVNAESARAARATVAAAVPHMEFATDPLIYECIADSMHTPHPGEVVDDRGRAYAVLPSASSPAPGN